MRVSRVVGWSGRTVLRALVKAGGPERVVRSLVDLVGFREVLRHIGAQGSPSGVATEALLQNELARLHDERVGAAHGVGRAAKEELVQAIERIAGEVPSGMAMVAHVALAREVLSLPASVPGDIVECGCWKGAATAVLSRAVSLIGRRLLVCDSFQGLPEDEPGVVHHYPHLEVQGGYSKAMYAGSLEQVEATVARHGVPSVCTFVPGFFADTLGALAGPFAFVIADVDLRSSLLDCLRHLWPRLSEGGLFYTDDSCDMEVVRVWFDDPWWRRELGQPAPGYVGSGCGLPLTPDCSALGYARKVSVPAKTYARVAWLAYPEADPRP